MILPKFVWLLLACLALAQDSGWDDWIDDASGNDGGEGGAEVMPMESTYVLFNGFDNSSAEVVFLEVLLPYLENMGIYMRRYDVMGKDGFDAIKIVVDGAGSLHDPLSTLENTLCVVQAPLMYFCEEYGLDLLGAITLAHVSVATPAVIVSEKYSTFEEIIALGKNGKKVRFGSFTAFSGTHVLDYSIKKDIPDLADADFVVVEDRQKALNMVKDGSLDALFMSSIIYSTLPDTFKILAVASSEPPENMMDVPLLSTFNVTNSDVSFYIGLGCSSATSDETKKHLGDMIAAALAQKGVLRDLRAKGFIPTFYVYPSAGKVIGQYYNRVVNYLNYVPDDGFPVWGIVLATFVILLMVAAVVFLAIKWRTSSKNMTSEDIDMDIHKSNPTQAALEILKGLKATAKSKEHRKIISSVMHTLTGRVDVEELRLNPEDTETMVSGQSKRSKRRRRVDSMSTSTSRLSSSENASASRGKHTGDSSSDYDSRTSGRTASTLDIDTCIEIGACLEEWGYNPQEFCKRARNQPLRVAVVYYFHKYKLGEMFEFSRMNSFITHIEKQYIWKNPYHNALHAADCVQACMYIMEHSDVFPAMTKLDIFTLLFSAAIHDVGHVGRTNNYLISIKHSLALTYNDKSVLENYAVALSFKIMQKHEDANVFEGMNMNTALVVRNRIIGLVLATDLVNHKHIMDSVVSKRTANNFRPLENADDRMLFMKMVIKVADLCNAYRPTEQTCFWADRVCREFYDQGDSEKKRGLSPSQFMDRTQPNIPLSQYSFDTGLVHPMVDLFTQLIGKDYLLKHLVDNEKFWKGFIDDGRPYEPATKRTD